MSDLTDRVGKALSDRAATGRGFVLVLGSAPREDGPGVKHGVGRSALADAVASAIGGERLSTGKIFRDMALEQQLPIEEFHRLIPEHPEWDADLDRRVAARIDAAKQAGECLVIDSNLAAILGKPDLALRVDVPDAVRARRVMSGKRYGDRPFSSEAEALAFLDARSEEEVKRYENHPDPLYANVDLTDGSHYQGVLDNSQPLDQGVAACLERILEIAKRA